MKGIGKIKTLRYRPNWLFPDEWESGEVASVVVELYDSGIMMPEIAMMMSWNCRWEDEFEVDCSFCGNIRDHYAVGDTVIDEFLGMAFMYKCRVCRKRFSITSRTHLNDTKIPMEYWCRTAYLLGDFDIPVNSHWLGRELGLTQKTTHHMLIVIVRALDLPLRSPVKTNKGTHDILSTLLTVRK